jgi:hypothetical protein
MGRRVVLYSSVTQPASQPASQPPSQPASQPDRLTYQIIQNGITHQPLVGSSSNLELKLREPNHDGIKLECKKYQMKTTSNGRRPQNIKSRISQQPLVGSYSNLKLMLLGSNKSVQRYQMKMTSDRR